VDVGSRVHAARPARGGDARPVRFGVTLDTSAPTAPGTRMPPTPVFQVVEPGLRTTIQDTGRPAAMALRGPRSGACDPLALAAANLLAGNRRDAPALEINLLGPELRVLGRCVVALAGADCDVRLEPSGERLAVANAAPVETGTRIVFGAMTT